ncbi:MAG: hypothetical protein LBQ35_08620 [Spirochaetaceae bacterium]|jgi:hypothetical protein|nr:hypothetical protein [Spirochaetaceae bacterium]
MPRRFFLSVLILLAHAGSAQEVLRGQVFVDREPLYALSPEDAYPLDAETVRRRALEETSFLFAAMIYGWDFTCEVGERARGTAPDLALERRGGLGAGDARLRVTDARLDGQRFSLWADYRLSDSQRRRMEQWRSGQLRTMQATGRAPLSWPGEAASWLAGKEAALEDAALTGLRELLRGRERNRPRAARGRLALAEFPRFYFDQGQWAASARFRVEITEIEPYAVY